MDDCAHASAAARMRQPSGLSSRSTLVSVLEQLDFVFDLEFLSLDIVDQVFVGHRPVDLFLEREFQALMPGAKGLDTILQRHAAPPCQTSTDPWSSCGGPGSIGICCRTCPRSSPWAVSRTVRSLHAR